MVMGEQLEGDETPMMSQPMMVKEAREEGQGDISGHSSGKGL